MIQEDGLFQFYGEYSPEKGLKFDANNLYPAPELIKSGHFEIVVLGSPILGEGIDKKGATKLILHWLENDSIDQLRSLNGEFCFVIVNHLTRELFIVNDRFASIPIHYLVDGSSLIFSLKYSDLWTARNLSSQIDPFNLFEFVWFTRLMGEKNLDKGSRFLTAASTLQFDGKATRLNRYWHPNFEKSEESVDSLSRQLAEAIKRSLKYKTSDQPNAGLFLSGGIDSRIILSAFEQPPICYTLTIGKNLEYQVANKVASIAKAEHVYLPMPEDQYSNILKESALLCGGQYAYDHAIFLGYGKEVTKGSNVAFHGHGIDYMFQGMYLPISRLKLFGKTSSYTSLLPFPENYVEYFVNEIPYRTKYVDLLKYLKPQYRKEFYDRLCTSVQDVIDGSEGIFPTSYDKYEYLITSDLSRHYSNPNISSLMTYMEQRTVVFENGVFDLFHKIPAKAKLNGKLARKTLKILNREMSDIITANTRTRASSGPFEKSFIRAYDHLYKGLRKKLKNEMLNHSNQRTWPVRDYAFQNEASLRQAAVRASRSEHLHDIGIFEMDQLKKDVALWLNPGTSGFNSKMQGGAFMTALISINEFLSQ